MSATCEVMAKFADDGVLPLRDCLGVVVIDVVIEKASREEMLMENELIAERTKECILADTSGT